MTRAFDDKARFTMLSEYDKKKFLYNGVPVREMEVKQVDAKFARPYIATFHYSGVMPDSSKYIYAGYFKDVLCGICVFGMGAGRNQYTAIIPDIEKGQYLELTRLWCANDMPRNTESKLISKSLKMLPDNIKMVISFADGSKNHVGTIYQATNWNYIGTTSSGRVLVTEDGQEQHARLLGIYKARHPELKQYTNQEIMQLYGWSYKEASSKNRYVYFLGNRKDKKAMYFKIRDRVLPYPKISGEVILKDEETIINEWCVKMRFTRSEQISIFDIK